jgi:serine/threonine protein phosphatase PrpC
MLQMRVHELSQQGGRAYQEDACGHVVAHDVACFVVADGAGGHGGGDLASRLVVRAILDQHAQQGNCSPEGVNALIQRAQQVVLAGQARFAQYPDMRSTVVTCLVDLRSGRVVFGNVGDSRGYWFRRGELKLQTRDHSLVQQMVEAGMITRDQMRTRKERSVLTSSLGSAGDLDVYIYELDTPGEEGDSLLLCTDGLWEYVLESEMEDVLRLGQDGDRYLDYFHNWVRTRAPSQHDNYTAQLCLFGAADDDPESTVIGPAIQVRSGLAGGFGGR